MATEPMSLTSGFEDVYRREYPGLVAVATALTGDVRDGDNAVQDTMVKAFVRWDAVGRLERLGAWCHRVLLNACRSGTVRPDIARARVVISAALRGQP